MKIHSFVFRQINPAINEVVAESLSEDINQYNMKKVRVNAQVKMMVSFIEAFVNMAYVIVRYFTIRTSFGTLMIQNMLYMIILPYFSLMNTSYNKDRIIDKGWKNIFKNLWLGKVFNRLRIQDPASIQNNREVQNNNEKESAAKRVNRNRNNKIVTNSTIQTCGRYNKIKPIEKNSLKLTSSTSKESKNSIQHELVKSTKSEIQIHRPNTNLSINEIVYKMLQHTNDEHEYLKFFKQLVGHVSRDHQTTCSSDDEFETDDLPNSISEISYGKINTQCNDKQSNHNAALSSNSSSSKMILDANKLTIHDHRYNSVENPTKLFRDNILKEIQLCSSNDQKKILLIEKLIHKEESNNFDGWALQR